MEERERERERLGEKGARYSDNLRNRCELNDDRRVDNKVDVSLEKVVQVGLIFFHEFEFEFECVGESLLATVLICVESLTRMMSRDKNSAKVSLSIRAKIFPIKSSCALFLFFFFKLQKDRSMEK